MLFRLQYRRDSYHRDKQYEHKQAWIFQTVPSQDCQRIFESHLFDDSYHMFLLSSVSPQCHMSLVYHSDCIRSIQTTHMYYRIDESPMPPFSAYRSIQNQLTWNIYIFNQSMVPILIYLSTLSYSGLNLLTGVTKLTTSSPLTPCRKFTFLDFFVSCGKTKTEATASFQTKHSIFTRTALFLLICWCRLVWLC